MPYSRTSDNILDDAEIKSPMQDIVLEYKYNKYDKYNKYNKYFWEHGGYNLSIS